MKKIIISFLTLFWLISCNAKTNNQKNAPNRKPNIVFFLVDDLGYTDLASYGNSHSLTPNIDNLSESGIRFTEAYAHPTCSPARGAILTGKSPARLHLTDFISGELGGSVPNEKGQGYPYPERSNLIQPDMQDPGLSTNEYTVAEVLKEGGYLTGFIGKWHLGKSRPSEHGFDWVKYITENGNPTFTNDTFMTIRKTNAAIEFMDKYKDKPFFLYFSLNAIHGPIDADPGKIKKFSNTPKPVLTAMISHVDDAVGALVAKLKELNLSDNTIIIFYSDNGAASGRNAPLRGHKGHLYEGGIKVPLIISWPEIIKANQVCNSLVIAEDFYPTILEMTNLPLEPQQHVDGKSFFSLLSNTKSEGRESLFWHYPHWFRPHKEREAFSPASAIRQNNWKLINFFEDGNSELYDLTNDIGELNDLSAKYPERVNEMLKELNDWRKRVDAQIPKRK